MITIVYNSNIVIIKPAYDIYIGRQRTVMARDAQNRTSSLTGLAETLASYESYWSHSYLAIRDLSIFCLPFKFQEYCFPLEYDFTFGIFSHFSFQ